MKGLQIFTHSLRQVLGNLEAAFRVSGLLYLAQVALSVIFDLSILQDQKAMQAAMLDGTFPWAKVSLVTLVSLITSLWIAVGWHRYVLMVEQPGIVPVFRGGLILNYFGKTLLVGLIVMVVAVVLGLVAAVTPLAFALVAVIIVSLLLANRLSVVLPGSALGKPLSISEGLAVTKGETWTILALTIITLVFFTVIELPSIYVFGSFPLLQFLWRLATGWLFLMVSISIMTTLYGHYVEKRPLL
ncbi:MAG: hypothetical protein WCC57_02525 [Paracoccaceae bacterium]